MRIGQLARKYNVSIQEIIDYLEEEQYHVDELQPNAKLMGEALEMVIARFGDFGEFETEIQEKKESEPVSVEPEVEESEPIQEEVQAEETIAENEPTISEVVEEIKLPVEKPKESITSDRLIEMMEAEDSDIDIEKFTHIKAPKKELEGLKVVGKIDLPEPKPKAPVESEEVKEPEDYRRRGNRRPPLSDEEKEKRRLRAKRKKEEYEARQEKRQKEKEIAAVKAKKEAHYRQKMEQVSVKPKTKPSNEIDPTIDDTPQKVVTKRKGPLGRFWVWLNGG